MIEKLSVLIYKGLIDYFDSPSEVREKAQKLFEFDYSDEEIETGLCELFELNYKQQNYEWN